MIQVLKALTWFPWFSSVQFSRSVVSNSLWPHESQHTRPLCPSPTPGVHPNPCPSSRWCHPAVSSSVVHFSSCPQSLSASGSFPMSQPLIKSHQDMEATKVPTNRPMDKEVVVCRPDGILLLLMLSHFSRVRLCATPEMAAHQAPPSLGFSRQEHWSGLPLLLNHKENEIVPFEATWMDLESTVKC